MEMEDLQRQTKRLLLAYMQMSEFTKDPLVISRGEGIRIQDIHGKTYIDGLSGIFVVNVGHGNRAVIEAMKAQMDRLSFAPVLYATNPSALELVELLSGIVPEGLTTFKLFSGGSEATEAAIKLARQYHRQSGKPWKYKIIGRYGGFHGVTMGAVSATGIPVRKVPFLPLLEGFLHIHPPYCYRCPYEKEWPSCNLTCARILEEMIQWEGPDTVAAFIGEPIMNMPGMLTPPPGYLELLREICDRYEVLLIYDEIVTGFGRTGCMFAAHTYEVFPDILCMGKGMSSGYAPLAGIAMKERIAKAFWGAVEAKVEFSHAHTYEGNPLSCVAGVANIREIQEKKLVENSWAMGDNLKKKLKERILPLGVVGDIRGKGLMAALELVKDGKTKTRFNPPLGQRIARAARDNGLIVRMDPHWIGLAPPLIITKAEIDEMVDILEKSIKEVL
ncbi:MAG: aspartate aminotransferase family protein [candidate division NC10 bacterium]|nr:aspartate aminotransferase family protein [candidate division NC10 bacterium]